MLEITVAVCLTSSLISEDKQRTNGIKEDMEGIESIIMNTSKSILTNTTIFISIRVKFLILTN